MTRSGQIPSELRVLIVDDDEIDRMAVIRDLKQLAPDATVWDFADADGALEFFDQNSCDIIFSDLNIPGHDGHWLLKQIRDRGDTTPVVVLTGSGDEKTAVRAMKKGATDYLAKDSLTPDRLAVVVRNSLRMGRAEKRSALATQALKDSEERLRMALDASQMGVWEATAVGRKVCLDERSQQLVGASEAVIGIDALWDLIVEEDLAPLISKLGSLAPSGLHAQSDGTLEEIEFRVANRDPSREIRWLRISGRFVSENGAITRVIGTVMDVSERKRRAAQDEQRSRFEQQLVGIVSHDLRNPLSAIMMGAAMLKRKLEPDSALNRTAVRIVSSVGRASRLIDDLLDFTQAGLGGGIPIRPQPCSLQEVLNQSIDEARLANPTRNIDLEVIGAPQGMWDAERITQCVGNLIGNALVYSPQESFVSVKCQEDKDGVRIDVHNRGEPIDPQKIATIFLPFRREPHERREGQNRSIGLGLYIVDEIVKAHGGSISVESTAVAGTTFSLQIPRGRPTPTVPSPSAS